MIWVDEFRLFYYWFFWQYWIWVFFEDVNDGFVMELCFLEEIGEGIYEQLAIYIIKKKKSPTQDPTREPKKSTQFFELGRVLGSQTWFLSYRVSGHSKPNLIQPNITPSSNIEKFYILFNSWDLINIIL